MADNPKYASLTANQETVLTFDNLITVEVVKLSEVADPVYFTVDGSSPEIEATGSYVVAGGSGAFTQVEEPARSTQVKLKSAAAQKVMVTGW